jgi:hypothetical protein
MATRWSTAPRVRTVAIRLPWWRNKRCAGPGNENLLAAVDYGDPVGGGRGLTCPEFCGVVRSPNQRSTWLIQDEPVGVKCMWNRGCRVSQASMAGVLWVP